MCNNMSYLRNLLSSDFGGHFSHFNLYFTLLSPEDTYILQMVEPRSFAVSACFRLKRSFYNLILKFSLHTRPPKDGMTSEYEPCFIKHFFKKRRSRGPGLCPTSGLKSPCPRTSCRPLGAWYKVRTSKL